MFQTVGSASRVAAAYWYLRFARTVPMYTDDAMAVLGLPATASLEEAKRAFRTLIMIHHPDRGGDTAKAQDIIAAWTQLKDGITIPRPYGSRPTPTPPRPQPAPPRPTPQPAPTPPSSNPHVKMTWQRAERLTGGNSRPDAKDKQRIDDMAVRAVKSRGNIPAKLTALAQQMANSIDSVDKALRRGRACEEHASIPGASVGLRDDFMMAHLSQIFYARAQTLAGL